MEILVTGASGFIGSHLVESLVKEKKEVRCFIRPCSDVSFLKNFNVKLVHGDLKDLNSLKKATKDVELIYHLAAVAKTYQGLPVDEYKKVNVMGTRNLMEAARLNDVKEIVYCSSIDAVGPSLDGKPLTEETPPHPINIYGKSKLGGELVIKEYFKEYGMDGRIVRAPTVYGPRNLLYTERLFKAVKMGWYPIVGNGKTLMEFCFVGNLVHGMKLVAERGKAGEIYFISDERPYTLEEIVKEIGRQMNKNVKIIHVPIFLAYGFGLITETLCWIFRAPPFCVKETGRPAFSRNTVRWTSKSVRICDISKARRELGYDPPFSLSEGIKQTIEWHRKNGLL